MAGQTSLVFAVALAWSGLHVRPFYWVLKPPGRRAEPQWFPPIWTALRPLEPWGLERTDGRFQ
jgi:hypothetical protein